MEKGEALDSHTLLWKQCDVLHSSSTNAADQDCQMSRFATAEAVKNALYPMRGEAFLIQGLHDLCAFVSQSLGKPISELKLCEIGSYSGESTIIFAERFGSVLAIDPWMDDYDPSDATCQHASFTKVEAAFDERVSRYHNIRKLKATSDAAFLTLQSTTFDVVYIDGLHTYEQVRRYIMNYRHITTGVIAGHDFNPVDWPGVHRAVTELFGDNIQRFMDTSWATIL